MLPASVQPFLPPYMDFVIVALVVWVVVQVVIGRFLYKHTDIRRRDNPRAYWTFIGIEGLLAASLACAQFGAFYIGAVFFTIVALGAVGFFLWALFRIAINSRKKNRPPYI